MYAVNSKKIISKVYLKSRLNTVFLRPGFDPHLAPEGEGVMEDPKSDDESEEVKLVYSVVTDVIINTYCRKSMRAVMWRSFTKIMTRAVMKMRSQ